MNIKNNEFNVDVKTIEEMLDEMCQTSFNNAINCINNFSVDEKNDGNKKIKVIKNKILKIFCNLNSQHDGSFKDLVEEFNPIKERIYRSTFRMNENENILTQDIINYFYKIFSYFKTEVKITNCLYGIGTDDDGEEGEIGLEFSSDLDEKSKKSFENKFRIIFQYDIKIN